MKTSKAVVPVIWFRVAVASQLFMEGAAGYLLFSALREVTRALEPASASSALAVLSLIETAYFAVGFVFLLYCCFLAKPPSQNNFTNTKWWMAWALIHMPVRSSKGSASTGRARGLCARDEDSSTTPSMGINPATGLSMIDDTLLDIGGNTFGSGHSDSDLM